MLRLIDLLEILNKNGLLKKYNISKAAIFGSILHSNEPNDIDILVSEYSNYKELIGFRDELEQVTGKKVDIMIEKYAEPITLYRAKKDMLYVA
jgi:uncharacterized protein